MEIQLNAEDPFLPRQILSSAAYARHAETAKNLEGGVVNASEILISGTLAIDSSGAWIVPTVILSWNSVIDLPAGFVDGIDNIILKIK